MAMQIGLRNGASAEINITPLIDVLLVLLIIFMCIMPTPIARGERAEIPRPETTSAISASESIVVELHAAGTGDAPAVTINGQDVSWGSLEERLAGIYKHRADRVAFIKGDPEIRFEFVAQVIDTAHRAGADRVGLMDSSRKLNRG